MSDRTEPPTGAAFAHVARGYYPILVAVFTATLIISNVCATKGVAFLTDYDVMLGPLQILPINTDGAFFLFPLAYIIGDVLSEVYGFGPPAAPSTSASARYCSRPSASGSPPNSRRRRSTRTRPRSRRYWGWCRAS